MECKTCYVKPLTMGTKRFKCCVCGIDTIAAKESSDICYDCSFRFKICMSCGEIIKEEVKL